MARQAQHTLCNQLQYEGGIVQNRQYLEFRFFPNRLFTFDESAQKEFENKKAQSHPRKPCALCNNDSRLLETHFKGFTIISNFRPYSPECWLIKPTDHLDQSKIAEKSSELFDLAKVMGSAYTFAHSGYRGNSQQHLHIHAMNESLPLRKALDNGQLSLDADLPVIQRGKTTVRWMTGDQANNTAHFSGIHITGENRAEFEHAFNNTLKYLSNSDVCGAGGYNVAYWVDDNNSLHSFIFPRNQNANVNPQYVPEKQGYGILEMCGLLIMAPVNDKKVGDPAAKELASMQERPYEDFAARARNELTRLTPEQWQELANKF
ncbi:hypothetical protein [Endozoicomonas sp. YOMI1]|uniref:hypothetical protein n=1 Tax=Endozoicomonas sp. YOMI1 TaxID=2828739 RepID=UPI0021497814|nr:hypothetical protein [Endozoicomonas sp. YOMI1]